MCGVSHFFMRYVSKSLWASGTTALWHYAWLLCIQFVLEIVLRLYDVCMWLVSVSVLAGDVVLVVLIRADKALGTNGLN